MAIFNRYKQLNKNNKDMKINILTISLITLGLLGCKNDDIDDSAVIYEEMNELIVPPLIDSRMSPQPIELNIQDGTHEFFPGVLSHTKGYNGGYLGPTILMHKGDDVHLQFNNNIGESTSVHGHGLHVPGEVDGGPQLRIEPGDTWDVTLPIRQEASTNWYHPHLMGSTAEQVHAGLAGFYLIEDNNSQSLDIPKTYGVDDFPIAIQDRSFLGGRMIDYPVGQTGDLRENTLVINGTVDPFISVPKSNVRLRLLNASNSRSYEIFIKGNLPFHKIATEGGFLESPVQLTKIRMSPGERNEIIIDMSSGDVELMAYYLPERLNNADPNSDPISRVLYLKADQNLNPINTTLSQSLNTIQKHNEGDVIKTRNFNISNGKINGKSMNINVINEMVNKGELEKWKIKSGRHPFHMHGVSFLILSVNGSYPNLEDQGWKDTFMPNGEGEILLRFDYEATNDYPYMYHCHILEHEDAGMMGQFTVQ